MAEKARKVGRPTEVKVLTMVYAIQWLDEDDWYAGRFDDGALAITERDKALISMRADSTANEDSMRATLLHELLHTCTEASRFAKFAKEIDDVEEFMVALMAPVLMSVLNDNPDVVAYLMSVGLSE